MFAYYDTIVTMNTVLVVEDDADLRRLVRTYVENESMSCVEAASGDEALARLEMKLRYGPKNSIC